MPKLQPRKKKHAPEWQDYEPSSDDPRPIADPELEYEADKSGKIHTRKLNSRNQVLPGYGTTDFGINAFNAPLSEEDETDGSNVNTIALGAGLAATGYFLMSYRKRLSSNLRTLYDYALLMREASRT